jgi:hypothetical protein
MKATERADNWLIAVSKVDPGFDTYFCTYESKLQIRHQRNRKIGKARKQRQRIRSTVDPRDREEQERAANPIIGYVVPEPLRPFLLIRAGKVANTAQIGKFISRHVHRHDIGAVTRMVPPRKAGASTSPSPSPRPAPQMIV